MKRAVLNISRRVLLLVLITFLATDVLALAPEAKSARESKIRARAKFVEANRFLVDQIQEKFAGVPVARVLEFRYLKEKVKTAEEVCDELGLLIVNESYAERLGLVELWRKVLESQGITMEDFINAHIAWRKLTEREETLLRLWSLNRAKIGCMGQDEKYVWSAFVKILDAINYQWQIPPGDPEKSSLVSSL